MKIERNQPCPCGSGKKYKKCCWLKKPSLSPSITNLDTLISSKKNQIEKTLKDEVIIEENNAMTHGAMLATNNNWDRHHLPKILHKKDIDKVHILHELIHIQQFFIDGYYSLGHKTNLDPQIISDKEKFKVIPEDFVVHRIIKEQYKLNPIDNNWFINNNQLYSTDTDLEIAIKLIYWHDFSDIINESKYKKRAKELLDEAKKNNPTAHKIAIETINLLGKIDYTNKDNYDNSLSDLVKIFTPNHTLDIYPIYYLFNNGVWEIKDKK